MKNPKNRYLELSISYCNTGSVQGKENILLHAIKLTIRSPIAGVLEVKDKKRMGYFGTQLNFTWMRSRI